MTSFFKSWLRSVGLACVCATVLLAVAGATSAGAKTVVLQPCGGGSNLGFGAWSGLTGSFAQWTLETRCPSELTLAPVPGKTLGASSGGFGLPSTSAAHGTIKQISFDLLGGNGSATGLKQGVQACHTFPASCGPLVTAATDDVISPEHHDMTLANGQIPAGSDYVYLSGSCPTAPNTPCAPDRPLVVKNLLVTFDDTTPPTVVSYAGAAGEPTYDDDGNELAPSVGIPLKPDEWNTGSREIRARATDVGVGVKYLEFEMHHDGTTVGARWLEAAPGCGGSTYPDTAIPYLCPLTVTSIHVVPLLQAGIQWGMSQGLNHANVTAFDAAGNASTPLQFDFKLDNVKPRVKNLEVLPAPTNHWRASTRIALRWLNDGEQFETETDSGVAKAHYKVTSDDLGITTILQGDVVPDPDVVIDSIPLIDLPGPGRWNVALTTLDKAGNSSKPSVAQVWVDPTVPDKPVIDPIPLLSGAQVAAGQKATWSPPANIDAIASGICNYGVAVDQSPHTDPDHLVAGTKLLEALPPLLPTGANYVHVQAISCAGVKSEIADLKFEVDSILPAAVVSPPGPGGWYSTMFPFAASLTGTPEAGTLLSAVVDGAPDAWSGATVVPLQLPDGSHTVSLKVKDAAGNQSLQLFPVKSDGSKPSVGFSAFDPAHPALVRASATDVGSGVHEASMEYRAAGTGDWHALGDVARPAGGSAANVDLSAQFPDAGLPAGAYELQLRAIDVAGNESVVQTFLDGSPAAVNLPLRSTPSLTAGFTVAVMSKSCSGKGKKRKCRMVVNKSAQPSIRDSVVVDYGMSERLVGKLLGADGSPMAGGMLQILESVGGGAEKLLATVTSGADGEYSFAIAAGPSRLLSVRFGGDDMRAPASATAKLLTKAKISLRATRTRTASGWRLNFSGRVFASGATIPNTGKAVRLQFKTRSGWDEFPVLSTDRNGRFKYARNFSATGQPIHYSFRALVPWSDGWVYEAAVSPTISETLK